MGLLMQRLNKLNRTSHKIQLQTHVLWFKYVKADETPHFRLFSAYNRNKTNINQLILRFFFRFVIYSKEKYICDNDIN